MASLINCSETGAVVMSGILKAMNFAAIKHSFQKRKDAAGTPYINHPIGVANILYFEGDIKDLVTIQAAILHDTGNLNILFVFKLQFIRDLIIVHLLQ